MADGTCSVEGCERAIRYKTAQMCKLHWRRLKNTGTTDAPAFRDICSVVGCGRPHFGRGWCSKHYQRWYLHGDISDPLARPSTCSIEDCDDPVAGREWCKKHYTRWLRHGDPMSTIHMKDLTDEERFFTWIEKAPNGCWRWTGSLFVDTGYGQFASAGNHSTTAHRWAYEQFIGPVPDGLVVDHVCHNADPLCRGLGAACLHRRCANPAHLAAVTQSVNVRRTMVTTEHDVCRSM